MSDKVTKETKSKSSPLANIHFVIVAVILIAAALGWDVAIDKLKWATTKQAVPWPDSVEINPETFELISDVKAFGPFEVWQEYKKKSTLTDDIMEALGIGTTLDKERVDQRESNWYSLNILLDTRRTQAKGNAWSYESYYYTGTRDLVPHVPDACLVAGGATLVEDESNEVEFEIPGATAPWDGPIKFKRLVYEEKSRKYVTYYIFSMNGEPANDRLVVRRKLAAPWTRFCFFGKIQFSPRYPIRSIEDADAQAKDFVKYVLPSALRAMPTKQDVKTLEEQFRKQN